MQFWECWCHTVIAESEGGSVDQNWDSWQVMPHSAKGSQ